MSTQASSFTAGLVAGMIHAPPLCGRVMVRVQKPGRALVALAMGMLLTGPLLASPPSEVGERGADADLPQDRAVVARPLMGGSTDSHAEAVTYGYGTRQVVDVLLPVPEGWVVEGRSVAGIKQSIVYIATRKDVCARRAAHAVSGSDLARAPERAEPAPAPCSGDGLPPDPGRVGNATLLGVDSDASGVRDDVQRYILLEHADKPALIPLLMLHAATIQEAFRAFERGEAPPATYLEIVTANMRCAAYLSSDGAARLLDVLERVTNTPERWAAKLAIDKQAAGGMSIPVRDAEVGDCTHI